MLLDFEITLRRIRPKREFKNHIFELSSTTSLKSAMRSSAILQASMITS